MGLIMKFVITNISIDEFAVITSAIHPERTPIGPFDSREEAWEYARAIQTKYGRGGGLVKVSPLYAPEDLR